MRSPENPLTGKDRRIFKAVHQGPGRLPSLARGGLPASTSLPQTETPTRDKSRTVKKSPWKKVKIALGGLAALSIVEAAGAVYTERTNNVPLSLDVPTLLQDVAWPYTLLKSTLLKEKAPLFFDENATSSIVEAGTNTLAVSEETRRKAYQEQVSQNKDGPTVIFPVKFTNNGQRVEYEYQAPFIAGTDSKTGEPVTIERPGAINAHFDVGEEIVIPAENAEVFQFPPRIINGKEYFVGLWIKFQQNGETYAFGISGQDVRTFMPLGEAANAPLVPTSEGGTLLLSEAKNGLKLPLGTPVARVNINTNLNSGFSFSRYNPNNPHVNGRWESIRANFVTDNSTGQTKLLVPSITQ